MICVVPLPINVRLSSSNVTDFKLKSVPVALPWAGDQNVPGGRHNAGQDIEKGH